MSLAAIKKRNWRPMRRFALFTTGLIALGIIIGFFIFAVMVSRLTPPASPPKADGIVVWTGKGGDRLQAGAELLRGGYGERLLISGTNSQVSREAVLAAMDLPDALDACCVDMDQATDTADNARQTANWAQALGYDNIILVTSAYHMPRAEIEISSAAGRVGITSYPVRGKNELPWWRDGVKFKRMIGEYGKLILSFIRNNHARGTPPLRPKNTLDSNAAKTSSN